VNDEWDMCEVVTEEAIPFENPNWSNVGVGSPFVEFRAVAEEVDWEVRLWKGVACDRAGFGFLYASLLALFEYSFEESVVP